MQGEVLKILEQNKNQYLVARQIRHLLSQQNTNIGLSSLESNLRRLRVAPFVEHKTIKIGGFYMIAYKLKE